MTPTKPQFSHFYREHSGAAALLARIIQLAFGPVTPLIENFVAQLALAVACFAPHRHLSIFFGGGACRRHSVAVGLLCRKLCGGRDDVQKLAFGALGALVIGEILADFRHERLKKSDVKNGF